MLSTEAAFGQVGPKPSFVLLFRNDALGIKSPRTSSLKISTE